MPTETYLVAVTVNDIKTEFKVTASDTADGAMKGMQM